MDEHLETIKQYWDTEALAYHAHMEETRHYEAQKRLFKELRSYFQSPVLDLAAGPGYMTGILVQCDLEVVANDISDSMHQLLKARFDHNPLVTHTRENASAMSALGSYKTILCCNLLYYLSDPESAILEWKQNLQQNCVLVLFEEYPFHIPDQTSSMKSGNKLSRILHPRSPEEIIAMCIAAGLRHVETVHVPIDTSHDLYGFVWK